MVTVIDTRDSGKTRRLMELAKENNAIIACKNPTAMKAKSHAYGIIGLSFISYYEYVEHDYDTDRMVFIDELEAFAKALGDNLGGYSLTIGD